MNARRGMTLMEVVLALALMVLLGLFVVTVIRSVLGIWQAGERRGRGDLAFQATVEQLRGDLAALHNGRRGWLILDQWRARAATEEQPAWNLPRLRFLAKGAGLPLDDPSGERGVEVAWMLVPEDAQNSRLCRLVRFAQPEGVAESLADDDYAVRLARSGGGLAVMDGVAWLEWQVEDAEGELRSRTTVPAEAPYGFPPFLFMALDRVSGRARAKPPTLDGDLGSNGASVILRGSPPIDAEPFGLVGTEWLELRGTFPRFSIATRGARDTAAQDHPAGAPVYLAQRGATRLSLPAGGRRVVP